ncbi:MAG TPA: 4Fe-4S dicluster domain-containing protein [Candidatus Hypogeohydataceae bacterium YC41]
MVRIDYKVCNRCGGAKEKRCERICPGDLIGVNPEDDRPVVLYPQDCWACTACVKDCPVSAISLRLPFQILGKETSLKASVKGRKTYCVVEGEGGKKEEFEIEVIQNGTLRRKD